MSERYSSVAIGLHWAIAILLVGNIFLGWNMEDSEHRAIESLFQLHKSIGITVLFLSLARLTWRFLNPAPALPDDMSSKEKLASHLVHWLFYGLMIGIPLTGWILVSASKFSVSTVLFGAISWPHLPFLPELTDTTKSALHGPVEFFHSKGAWLVLILLGLHVAGAIKHELSVDSGVLKRMLPVLFGKTTPPKKTHGSFLALGGSLLLFIVIAALPVIGSSAKPVDPTQPNSKVSENWTIQQDKSFLTFSGTHDGNAFDGTFTNWTAEIQFDKNNLDDAKAVVTISTSGITTSKKLYTDTLKAAEWFAPSSFPQAVVTVENFQTSDDGYVADAIIELKDTKLTTVWNFDLEQNSETGAMTMTGSTTVDRSKLDLGLKSDPTGNWVSLDIDIQSKVVATPVE